MDILNCPLTVSAPLISTLCSLHCRRHQLVHLVSLFKIKFFFGMAFLFFTAYRCSVPWQFLFTFPAFIPHYIIENPKHVLYFAGVLSCLIFLILFFSLPKFCLCSLYHYFSLIFFLPLQEMAHILAQKQLRSIILSVSLTMPFPSSPLQCIFPSLSLFISFRVYASAAE